MAKSNLAWIAGALAIFGVAVTAGYPDWGRITGVAILLLAGCLAVGAAPRASAEQYTVQRPADSKISSGLITFSSATILAIYAAGYHRTNSAADNFAAETARSGTFSPHAVIPTGEAGPKISANVSVAPSVPPVKAVRSRQAVRAQNSASAHPRSSTPTRNVPQPDLAAAGTAAEPDSLQHPYKDGTYLGWGSCRHGDLQVSVVIQGGQIASAEIVQCLTRYSCSWVANLPGQVVSRQKPRIDFVSGATESSEAFSDAITAALSHASE